MLTDLDVINAQLAAIGQAPITDVTRPNRLVSIALEKLRQASAELQARCWWFNHVDKQLVPTAVTGDVAAQLPVNTSEILSPSGFVLRKNGPVVYIYDLYRGEIRLGALDVRLRFELPFADLPALAQAAVRARAVADFVRDQDPVSASRFAEVEGRAMRELRSESIDRAGVNMLASSHALEALYWNRGRRPYLSSGPR